MPTINPKKSKPIYRCQECGYESGKWLGRCPNCQSWESFSEEIPLPVNSTALAAFDADERPLPLSSSPDYDYPRLPVDIEELDRVLGGGIVPGSVILIGGEPGIGKSTLILQLLARLADQGKTALYVSGESAHQIKLRARRLNAVRDGIFLATVNETEKIIAMAEEMRPALLAVDSVQTLVCQGLASAPGTVSQVRDSSHKLMEFAKRRHVPVALVGHVTKDGALAGPKLLEHMVDTVLYFEGDRSHAFRILRTVKNRFGSTNEIGVFEMKEEGLAEIKNPSEIFLAERPLDEPGSVVAPIIEGSRPILVEIQALVSPTNLGTARRTSLGADHQRLALLTAVLEKKGGFDMYGHDIFLNVAGGIRVEEPAADLGIVAALASSRQEIPIPSDTALCGEIGLAGEVRAVGHIEIRVREAQRLGFKRMILPANNRERLPNNIGIEVAGIRSLHELLQILFSKK
jgi:DNA repair protein RadA/Sms